LIHILRETHDAPAEVAETLRVAGGVNRFGEPNFRCVWGWARLDYVGGKFEDREPDGRLIRENFAVRRIPKYIPHDRWHIERWLPPESYGSPERWYAETMEAKDPANYFCTLPALGPYPSRGDWEHCFTVETPIGGFLQVTPAIARHIARAIECSRNMPRPSLAERKSRHIAREDREYDSYADSLFNTGSTITGPQVSVL
jgi:hypothetical protein